VSNETSDSGATMPIDALTICHEKPYVEP